MEGEGWYSGEDLEKLRQKSLPEGEDLPSRTAVHLGTEISRAGFFGSEEKWKVRLHPEPHGGAPRGERLRLAGTDHGRYYSREK